MSIQASSFLFFVICVFVAESSQFSITNDMKDENCTNLLYSIHKNKSWSQRISDRRYYATIFHNTLQEDPQCRYMLYTHPDNLRSGNFVEFILLCKEQNGTVNLRDRKCFKREVVHVTSLKNEIKECPCLLVIAVLIGAQLLALVTIFLRSKMEWYKKLNSKEMVLSL